MTDFAVTKDGEEVEMTSPEDPEGEAQKEEDESKIETVVTSDTGRTTRLPPKYKDHFSLERASSTVTYRGAKVHVYGTGRDQFILEEELSQEEEGEGVNITVKKMGSSSLGLTMLRLSYSLVSLLLVGIFFVFCIQIMLFLFLNFLLEGGRTYAQAETNAAGIIGGALSIPIFLTGMSALMAMGVTFVIDVFKGGLLLRALLSWTPLVTEIIYFVMFLVIPLLIFVGVGMAQYSDPWEITAIAWVSCVGLVFIMFAMAVVYREIEACFQLISLHCCPPEATFWDKLQTAVIMKITHRFAGVKRERYLVSGSEREPPEGYTGSPNFTPVQVNKGLWTRMTELSCLGCLFETLDPPQRIFKKEEVQDRMSFITRTMWSVEGQCCGRSSDRTVTAAKGPSALRRKQVLTSMVCNLFGAILMVLVLVALLVWFSMPSLSIILFLILGIVFVVIPMTRESFRMLQMYRNIHQAKNISDFFKEDSLEVEDNAGDTTIFQKWESLRVTKPKKWGCIVILGWELIFLFLFPIITLFSGGKNAIATVFLVMGFFSALRRYLDVAVILAQLGPMSRIDVEKHPGEAVHELGVSRTKQIQREARTLMVKSRLSHIVGDLRKKNINQCWAIVFGVFAVAVAFLLITALSDPNILPDNRNRPPIVLLDDFYYEEADSVAYPTCQMNKGFPVAGVGEVSLVDFAFMSALAYERQNMTQVVMEKWFGGPDLVRDEDAFVKQYRKDSNTEGNPVYFKLFTFPSLPGTGVMAIRGSETSYDWLVNMQLWSAAGLTQVFIKWLLPFGWIWHPILDDIVWVVKLIEDPRFVESAYYKVTSNFVDDILKNGYTNPELSEGTTPVSELRVTGASLGGGLAIITGAQTGAFAIAISGLGAEYTRNTLDPPVTEEQLDKNVFNFVPERDFIARIGGRIRQAQDAFCIAPKNSPFGCHSMWRSVCELSYTCGTNGRPVVCRCVEKMGYPEPIQNGTRTFAEACAEERAGIEVIIASFS